MVFNDKSITTKQSEDYKTKSLDYINKIKVSKISLHLSLIKQ